MQMTIDGFMAPPEPEQTDTLTRARADLQSRLADGVTCPCCDQYAKIYRRPLNANMAIFLCSLVKISRDRVAGGVVTDKGIQFAMNQIRVPKRVHLYNNEVIGWDEETTCIVEAMGKHFDYAELMGGE